MTETISNSMKNGYSQSEIIDWLESPEGEKWSYDYHHPIIVLATIKGGWPNES